MMGSQAILVVDDEWDIAEVIVFLLAGWGYQATYASDGLAALDMLSRTPADLVLTDLMMPSMDGAELVSRLRAMDDFAATPILVMSAVPEDLVREACPLATGFIRKPFAGNELLIAVHDILGRAEAAR